MQRLDPLDPASNDASPANPLPPAQDFSALPGGVGSWIGALQITAALAAIGFIAKLAHEQLLGIQLTNWTALDLSIIAGRWAIDTLTIVLEQPAQNKLTFLLPALILVTPVFLALALPASSRHARTFFHLSLGFAAAGLLWTLVWCELPSMDLHNWLNQSLEVQLVPPGPGFMSHRKSALRSRLFVAKMEGLGKPGGIVECPTTSAPDILLRYMPADNRFGSPSAQNVDYLENIYGFSVLICLVSWLTLSLSAPPTDSLLTAEIFRVLRLAITLFFLPVAAALLPYMYGKLILTTQYPTAYIKLKDPAAPPVGPQNSVLLIGQESSELTLLRVQPDRPIPSILLLRNDSVDDIKLGNPEDVINQSIRNCQWFPINAN